MSDDDGGSRLQNLLHSVLADAAHEFDGSLLGQFVACLEVLDDNGDRALILSCSPHMKSWHTLGLLTFAIQQEQAQAVRADDDDTDA